ncbi:unnamed protein product [Miscanthus lutarioriparius]|uniref:Uncharacterized protein n=1 Tax=Miscanthus lutarioriparius TaxID=422564 RepID=A0A811QI90_9POAL|nr:unnamed protein product [Miscanthus lutarioriparius]
MTWNGDVLKAYHGTLNIKPPVESVMGTRDIRLPGITLRGWCHRDEFWIEKLESKERIVHGQRVGDNYVVAVLDVGAATSWVLDSSAWIHHTSNRQMLYDFQEAPEYLLPAPAGVEGLHILGHGSVRTQRFKVPGIRYIASSGDARNVISVAQLADDHGFVSTFEPGFCYVKDKVIGQIVGVGHLLGSVYVLKTLRINQDKGGGSGLSQKPRDDSSKSQKRPGRADTVGMTMTGNLESVQTDRDKCFRDTSTPNYLASNQRLLLGTGSFQETADDLLQRNVVSVAQLASSHGLVTVFEPTGCYMKDKKTGQIVAHGHLRDGAFVLDNLLINQEKGPGRSGAANKQREQELAKIKGQEIKMKVKTMVTDLKEEVKLEAKEAIKVEVAPAVAAIKGEIKLEVKEKAIKVEVAPMMVEMKEEVVKPGVEEEIEMVLVAVVEVEEEKKEVEEKKKRK